MKIDLMASNFPYDPRLMSWEGEGEGGGAGGGDAGDAGGDQGDAGGDGDGGGDEAAAAAAAAASAATATAAWRDSITDDDAKKFAESSTDINHLAKRGAELRAKLGKAVVLPGKDAPEEEVTAYRKAIGVPDTAEGYEFPAPPEGQDLTDEQKESRSTWAKFFHERNVPAGLAKDLITAAAAEATARETAQAAADKQFAEQADATLRAEWAGDYDRNMQLAKAAFKHFDTEDAASLEMKDGRMLLDHPVMMKFFGRLGREMGEGQLGPTTLPADQVDGIQGQIADLRKRQDEAMAADNRDLAQKLSDQELALHEKLRGTSPIVGEAGRAA